MQPVDELNPNANGSDEPKVADPEPPPPRIRKINMEPAEPLDLIEVAAGPALKRIVPAAVILVLLCLVVGYRRRRRA